MRKILYNTKAADPDPVRPVIPSVAKVFGVMGLTLCFSVASIAPAYAQNIPGTVAPSPAATPPPISSWWAGFPRIQTGTVLKSLLYGVMTYTVTKMFGAVAGVNGDPYFRNAIPDQNLHPGQNLNVSLPSDLIGNYTSDLSLTVSLANGGPLPDWLQDQFTNLAITGTTSASVSGSARRVSAEDGRVYVLEDNGIRIFDINEFMHPQSAGFFDFSSSTIVSDAVIQNKIAYTLGNDGLSTVDISDPDNPQILDNIAVSGEHLALQGDSAFILGGNSLQAVNIRNASNMQLLGNISTSYINQIALHNNRAYTSSSSGFEMFDISNPANMSSLGTQAVDSIAQMAAVNNQIQLVQGNPILGYTLNIFNVQTPNNVSNVGDFAIPNLTGINDYIIGDQAGTAYLSGEGGFEVLQTGDPQNISLAAYYNTSTTINAFATMGNTAIFISSGNPLQTINLGQSLTGMAEFGVFPITFHLEDNLGNIHATSNMTITVTTLPPTVTSSLPPSLSSSINLTGQPTIGPTLIPTTLPTALPSFHSTASPSPLVSTFESSFSTTDAPIDLPNYSGMAIFAIGIILLVIGIPPVVWIRKACRRHRARINLIVPVMPQVQLVPANNNNNLTINATANQAILPAFPAPGNINIPVASTYNNC